MTLSSLALLLELTCFGIGAAGLSVNSTALVTGVLTANGGAVFNESGADVDFRVESDTNANALFVQGSDGKVGIGASPIANLSVLGGTSNASDLATAYSLAAFNITPKSTSGYSLQFGSGPSDLPYIQMSAGGTASGNLLIQPYGGDVGIGTTSPANKLHTLSGSSTATVAKFAATNYGNAGTTYIEIGTEASDGGSRIGSINPTGNLSTLVFETMTAASGVFAERMRIDSSGNLLVAGTSCYTRLELFVLSPINMATFGCHCGFCKRFGLLIFGAVTNQRRKYRDNLCFRFSHNLNTSSDYRLKTDAQPMTGASARVQALKPVNFEWISSGERVDGFLAHEAQEVVPECVTGTKDAMRDEEYEVTAAVYEDIIIAAVLDEEGNELEAERTEQRLVTEAVMGTRSVPDYQGIDQSKLVPLLTAALQEALTKIADMEIRLSALEG
jgi:hypothetical protein